MLLISNSNIITAFATTPIVPISSTVAASTATATTAPIKLTYFDIEGVAESVRLALLLSDTPFEDVRIGWNDWATMKPTTPNGQLPLMTIGDEIKTQSKAMLRWIGATKSDTLYPIDKIYEIEEVIGDLEDLQRAFQPAQGMGMRASIYGHPDGYEKTDDGKKIVELMRTKFVKDELPKYINRFTDRMNKHGGPYLVVGTEPTIADCMAIPILRSFTRGVLDYVDPKCLHDYPTIISYIQTVCALDPIQGRYTDGVY